mgnify:FL=1
MTSHNNMMRRSSEEKAMSHRHIVLLCHGRSVSKINITRSSQLTGDCRKDFEIVHSYVRYCFDVFGMWNCLENC